jgi:hypothetical protein
MKFEFNFDLFVDLESVRAQLVKGLINSLYKLEIGRV